MEAREIMGEFEVDFEGWIKKLLMRFNDAHAMLATLTNFVKLQGVADKDDLMMLEFIKKYFETISMMIDKILEYNEIVNSKKDQQDDKDAFKKFIDDIIEEIGLGDRDTDINTNTNANINIYQH